VSVVLPPHETFQQPVILGLQALILAFQTVDTLLSDCQTFRTFSGLDARFLLSLLVAKRALDSGMRIEGLTSWPSTDQTCGLIA